MEEIGLTSKEFKAFSSENRIKMLKLLKQQNHTLSEISKKLSLSGPTAKQHLEVLVSSQLIEQLDEGRKWKYYSLTRKGKKILESRETQTQVFILLSIASLAFAGILGMLFATNFTGLTASTGVESAPIAPPAFDVLQSPTAPNTTQTIKGAGEEKAEDSKTVVQRTTEPRTQEPIQAIIRALAAILGLSVLALGAKYYSLRKNADSK